MTHFSSNKMSFSSFRESFENIIAGTSAGTFSKLLGYKYVEAFKIILKKAFKKLSRSF